LRNIFRRKVSQATTDSAETTRRSSFYNSLPYAGVSSTSTRGLFGQPILDRELVFMVMREPSANRICFGVAKDMLDNWFKIKRIVKKGEPEDNGELNAKLQAELQRLNAKQILTKWVGQARTLGYAELLLGYEDDAESLSEEVTDKASRIRVIESYSKMELRTVKEDKDPTSVREGLPETYVFNKASGLSSKDNEVHWSRIIHYSPVLFDHKWKGWSTLQVLYDDIVSSRYMRWSFYMTIIRYGAGFPDITLKHPDFPRNYIKQGEIDTFKAAGNFDNLDPRAYFVHNEVQELEFKGFAGHTLDPMPYWLVNLETLSLGSGIPQSALRGQQKGAIEAGDKDERAYFKIISDEQSNFEGSLKIFIDRVLWSIGEGTEEAPISYVVEWNPQYEMSAKEKLELEILNAQAGEAELKAGLTVNEVRAKRFNNASPIEGGDKTPALAAPSSNAFPNFPAGKSIMQTDSEAEWMVRRRKRSKPS